MIFMFFVVLASRKIDLFNQALEVVWCCFLFGPKLSHELHGLICLTL